MAQSVQGFSFRGTTGVVRPNDVPIAAGYLTSNPDRAVARAENPDFTPWIGLGIGRQFERWHVSADLGFAGHTLGTDNQSLQQFSGEMKLRLAIPSTIDGSNALVRSVTLTPNPINRTDGSRIATRSERTFSAQRLDLTAERIWERGDIAITTKFGAFYANEDAAQLVGILGTALQTAIFDGFRVEATQISSIARNDRRMGVSAGLRADWRVTDPVQLSFSGGISGVHAGTDIVFEQLTSVTTTQTSTDGTILNQPFIPRVVDANAAYITGGHSYSGFAVHGNIEFAVGLVGPNGEILELFIARTWQGETPTVFVPATASDPDFGFSQESLAIDMAGIRLRIPYN